MSCAGSNPAGSAIYSRVAQLWSERRPVTPKVAGSSPVTTAILLCSLSGKTSVCSRSSLVRVQTKQPNIQMRTQTGEGGGLESR